MSKCEHRQVAGAHTLPANHKRIGFKSVAGITEVCLIKGPSPSVGVKTAGQIAWVEFPSPHDGPFAWHTIPVPVSQLVEL